MTGSKQTILGGLALSATEPDTGVAWTTATFKGWAGPASSITVANKQRAHGGSAGKAYLRARHMTLGGVVDAPTPDALADAIDRLTVACSLEDTLFEVIEGRRSRWCMVCREDEVLADEVSPTAAEWSIQVVALDPRKLGATVTGSTRLPSSTGGFTFPHAFPFAINQVSVSGQVSLTNDGNFPGPVRLRIDGPVIGPVVRHSSGLVLTFAPSAELRAGEWLDVDIDALTVMANGQQSRGNWLLERGFAGFAPGGNTWSFDAAVYSPSALLTVTATSADQ